MVDSKDIKLSSAKVTLITVFLTLFILVFKVIGFYNFFSKFVSYDEIYGVSIYLNVTKVIWASIAFVFVVRYQRYLYSSISEMFDFKRINLKIISIYLVLMFFIDLIGTFVLYGKLPDASSFNFIGSIIDNFIVGLTEETIFRGSMFNLSIKTLGYMRSNIIQSISFMMAHLLPYCYWLLNGMSFSSSTWNYLSMQLPFCLVSGFILGWIFNKTKSLWTTIIIHCFADVIGEFFIGTI